MKFVTIEELRRIKENESSEKEYYCIEDINVMEMLKLAVLDTVYDDKKICVLAHSREESNEAFHAGCAILRDTITRDSLEDIWRRIGMYVCLSTLDMHPKFGAAKIGKLWSEIDSYREGKVEKLVDVYLSMTPFCEVADKVWHNFLVPISQLSLEVSEDDLGIMEKRVLATIRNLSVRDSLLMIRQLIQETINSEATFYRITDTKS